MKFRRTWILWTALALAWVVPLMVGVMWLLTYQPNPASQTAEDIFHGMIFCILGMTASSILHCWMYQWIKRSARSTRWMVKGFVWSVALTFLGVLWIQALSVAMNDTSAGHGTFFGWFGYALIMVVMAAFNLLVAWRWATGRGPRRSRHRRRQRRRALEDDDDPAPTAPAGGPEDDAGQRA